MRKARGSGNKSFVIGISLLTFIIVLGIFAPWVAPHDPLAVNLSTRLLVPNWEYPFGTDHLGRCILSRIIYGVRASVAIAILIMIGTLLISLPIGLFTGYTRGQADHFFMRMIDGKLAIPDIVLMITIVGVLGPGLMNMIIAIILVRWGNYVRLVRSLVLTVCEQDYILSARMSGNTHVQILKRYILPEILSRLVVYGALDTGKIVLLIAGFSFLGLGAQPPTPEWGSMLHDATAYFQLAPHVMIFPGLAIFIFVLACHLISDQFKTWNNPSIGV